MANKKDFNKTYEKKMRDLMQEAELAEKAARNMFKTTKSKSDEDVGAKQSRSRECE